jgi:Fe-S-cluster containining protein
VLPVEEIQKAGGEKCIHCDTSGCRVHKTKPLSCKIFACNWLKGEGLEKHRPDIFGVVFDSVLSPTLKDYLLQVFEVKKGSLQNKEIKNYIRSKLNAGTPVLVIPMNEKHIFFAPIIYSTKKIMLEENVRFGKLAELE